MGSIEGVGFGEGPCTPPQCGVCGLAPRNFFSKCSQTLAIPVFAHFQPTRFIEEELFTAVKKYKTTTNTEVMSVDQFLQG